MILNNYGYIYKTTNLMNGKVYIGQKKGFFNPKYFGSGTLINQAVQKNGTVNFIVVIIKSAITKEEADLLEQKYIAEHRESLGKENVYNLADGGEGGGGKRSEETRKKMSLSRIGTHPSEETRRKLRNTLDQKGHKQNCTCFACRAKREKLPRETRTCSYRSCAETFDVSIHSNRKYCSMDCAKKARIGVFNTTEHEIRKCPSRYCNNTFDTRVASKRKYCSRSCVNKGRIPWNKLKRGVK